MRKLYSLALAAAIATVGVLPVARPAQADPASTAGIAAAAALIVGSLLVDSNNQPFYVNNGRHVYVSQNTANYYRNNGNDRNGHRHQHGNMMQNNHGPMNDHMDGHMDGGQRGR
jgi:hypothetical protein